MLLKVNGVVRLARDVEMRYTQSGSAMASFSVVSSKKYKTQSGEQKEDTTFIDCTAFSRLAEICNQYLHKGSQVYIVGELKLDQWTAQDGRKRSRHSITIESLEMLGSKDDNAKNTQDNATHSQTPQTPTQTQPQQNNGYSQQGTTPSVPENDISTEQIPFNGISKRLSLCM